MTTISPERRARLILMRAAESAASSSELRAFVQAHGPVTALQRISDNTAPRAVAADIATRRPNIVADVAAIGSGRARFITPEDAGWPLRLPARVDDPFEFTLPIGLWVIGRGNLTDVPVSLAIVGTASPVPATRDLTIDTARHHAARGATIIAPGHPGLDLCAISAAVTAAHRASPSAILVAPCGLDTLAATENNIAEAVLAADGLLVSEYPLDTPVQPIRGFDPASWLAGALAHATYVVDAHLFCPAMFAAHAAIALGRPVYALASRDDHQDTFDSNGLLLRRVAARATRPEDIDPAHLIEPSAAKQP